MNTDLKALVTTTDKDVQYDSYVKKILSRKSILAHILVNTIREFKGMNVREAAGLIEGDVLVSKVPVTPGYTNKKDLFTGKIAGLNTEDNEINEGMIRYDIIFYVRMKDGLSQIIVNIEAQKDEATEYKILNRGIFYICRMISSQKDREFSNMNYDKLKRVYSVWICMNAKENSMSHIHLIQEDIVNTRRWKGDMNLLNLVMIGLTNEMPPKEKDHELHRLLRGLLSSKLSVEEKLKVISDYDIELNNDMRKDVREMSTLSQAVREEGEKAGRKAGRKEGRAEEVFSSVRDGDYSIKRGMEKLGITDETVFRRNAAIMGIIISE